MNCENLCFLMLMILFLHRVACNDWLEQIYPDDILLLDAFHTAIPK